MGVAWPIEYRFLVFVQQRPHSTLECSGEGYAPGVLILEIDVELLSGGEMIARALEDEGVEYIFGYPGGAVLHIYDALFKDCKVPHVLVRHEQAATHAADGYARATGKPGVVLVTSGPVPPMPLPALPPPTWTRFPWWCCPARCRAT